MPPPCSIPSLTRALLGGAPGLALELLRDLETLQGLAVEERDAQQLAQLDGVLQLARRCPAQTARLSGFERIDSWDDFASLPILARQELQHMGRGAEFPNPPPAFLPRGESTTSGSTGTPLRSRGTLASFELSRALQFRFQRWHGFDFEATTCFLTTPGGGVLIQPEKRGRWATPLGAGPSVTFDLRAPSAQQLALLVESRARYLVTYPSNLAALLAESTRLGLAVPDLESVTVSSEPVSDELIEAAQRHWGVRVLSTYSSNELGAIALAVPDGDYAVMAESVFVEVLDDDGRRCRPGEVGRVVVSTLQDMLRPLLRYETGDYAEVGHTPSASAITLPRLKRIVGRERTMIRLPDGHRVWPYFEFGGLTRLERLKNWQLVQRRDASLEVRLVLEGALDDEQRGAILGIVNAALPGLSVTLKQVDAIERTARGKFLEVKSELD